MGHSLAELCSMWSPLQVFELEMVSFILFSRMHLSHNKTFYSDI